MIWFTETPWPGMLITGCAAAVTLFLWLQRRQVRYLLGSITLAILAPTLYFLEQAIVTPREQAEAAVLGITRAFQRQDIETTRSFISPQSPHLAMLAATVMPVIGIGDDMRLSDFRIDMSSKNTRANAKFRLNATLSIEQINYREFQPTRWETTWQLEAKQWRLIKLQELDPITGRPLHRMDELLYRIAQGQRQ